MFQQLLKFTTVVLLCTVPASAIAYQEQDQILGVTCVITKRDSPTLWKFVANHDDHEKVNIFKVSDIVRHALNYMHDKEEEEFYHHNKTGILGYRFKLIIDEKEVLRTIWIDWDEDDEEYEE